MLREVEGKAALHNTKLHDAQSKGVCEQQPKGDTSTGLAESKCAWLYGIDVFSTACKHTLHVGAWIGVSGRFNMFQAVLKHVGLVNCVHSKWVPLNLHLELPIVKACKRALHQCAWSRCS